MSRFRNRIVVVTGASTGIGAAAASAFAAEGAHVVLIARSEAPLRERVRDIEAKGGRATALARDLSSESVCGTVLDDVARDVGPFDVLVNNAGRNHRGPLEGRTPEELSGIVALNLTSPILLCRAAIPHFRRRGSGAIVNVASLAGRVPLPDEATYSATKFGLRAFSFALSEELRGSGISVSVVSPGPVATGFILGDLAEVPDLVFSQPLATAEEIGALVVESAVDGRGERVASRLSGLTSTVGYLFPAIRRGLTPLLEARGRSVKKKLLRV